VNRAPLHPEDSLCEIERKQSKHGDGLEHLWIAVGPEVEVRLSHNIKQLIMTSLSLRNMSEQIMRANNDSILNIFGGELVIIQTF
jgi:hypothetical protein